MKDVIASRLLDRQLAFDRAKDAILKQGVELSRALQFNMIDIIADNFGVPADNCADSGPGGGGVLSDGVYCRDFIWILWQDVVDGKITAGEYLNRIKEEGKQKSINWKNRNAKSG